MASTDLIVQVEPHWVAAGRATVTSESQKPRWELVSTYTREGAGFTCEQCPQPLRWWSERYLHLNLDGWHEGRVRTHYTVRCTECSRRVRRWSRAKNKAKRVVTASRAHEKGVSFVTLTQTNWIGANVLDGVREMKPKVAAFRERHQGVEGGYDFYEWTQNPDFKCWSNDFVWNVHQHGIWVMDYWPQREMQDAWSEVVGEKSIVHLKRVEDEWLEKNAVDYATKYASKSDVKGIRLSQAFGCLYGRAYSVVESYLHSVQRDSGTVEGVPESSVRSD